MKNPPRFLRVEDVIYLHEDTLKNEGGLNGLRELALLEAAVMMPQQQFGGAYLHPDLPSMAAAYLFHLTANHPFLDGNKRIGAMTAFVFLDLNGMELTATEEEFENTVMAVADSSLDKGQLTKWFTAHTVQRNP